MLASERMVEMARAHAMLSIRAAESQYVVENTKNKYRASAILWMRQSMRGTMTLHTYLSSVNYYDRTTAKMKQPLDASGSDLLRAACVLVAGKHDEVDGPALKDLTECTGLTSKQLLNAERELCRILEMDLIFPSPVYFLDYFVSMLHESSAVKATALHAIELFTFAPKHCTLPSSCIATCALWIARDHHVAGAWSHLHIAFCGYTTGQVEAPLNVWNTIPTSRMSPDCVALYQQLSPVSVWQA